MNTRLRKIFKDLTVRKGRSLLTLAGLIMGLWGVGAVSVAWHVLGADLNENFKRTNPPNLIVRTEQADPEALNQLLEIDGVVGIENRPVIMARIENGPNAWMPMALYVVEDFQDMNIARFWPEKDAFPPPLGEFVIERAGERLMQFMRSGPPPSSSGHGAAEQRHSAPTQPVEPIDGLKVRLPGGIEVNTNVAGLVFDPGMAPSTMERVIYGYISAETAQQWLGKAPGQRLLIKLAPEFQGIDAQRAMAARIEEVLNQNGLDMGGVLYPPADEHPHQFQLNSILFLLAGVGGLMLLLSVVLVVNLVNGLLSNQVRQIGSLKAIGASTAQVISMYLGSIWILGLASAAIALPLAMRAGYYISAFMAAMLNFEIFTVQLGAGTLISMVVIGSLFPVIAAVAPVRRWCSAPVRDALDNFGASNAGSGGSIMDRIPLPLPVNVRVGLRNSLRKPKRFALSVATVAVGALVFLVVMNVRSSLVHTADVEVATLNYDINIGFGESVTWEQISWIEQFPMVDKVELWQATGAQTIGLPAIEADSFALVAVPADTQAMGSNLSDGEWVSDDEPAGLVASHRFFNHYPELGVGDIVSLRARGRTFDVRIRGINKQFGATTLYLPESGYLDLTGSDAGKGRVAKVMMSDDAEISTRGLIAMLEDHFDIFRNAGQPLKVSGVQTSKIASAIIRNHLDMIIWILGAMAILMLLVSALGMASGIGTSIIERTREIGVLRAIGATPAAVRRILSVESLFIAMVAWLVSISLAPWLSKWVAGYFGAGIVEYPFDYKTSVTGLWLSLVVVIVLTLIATWGPVRGANRLAVSRAVAYE